MNNHFSMSFFAFLILCNIIVNISCQTGQQVINAKVERIIDITTQLVHITSRIVVDNSGNKKALESYLVTFEENHRSHLSYISGTINKNAVQVSKVDDKTWQVDLSGSNAIAPGSASSVIEIDAIFTHLLEPYPTEILQSERQLVMYNGNHYFYSPYLTKTQTTKVKLPTPGTLESYTKLKPSTQSDGTLNFGPYENVPDNSLSQMKVHVENNSPFLTVTNLERSLEISHWGGLISVEEIVDIRHTGARLKGSFSRYEYQREPTNGMSSVRSWRTKLPPSALDIYYRDDIGNISTSHVRQTGSHVSAELRPRFPLFGGWKTHYLLGYYIPTDGYLFNQANQFSLKIPFVDHIHDSQVIDHARVKVILPEGASDIKLHLPYDIRRDKDQVYYSYLDTLGRTVIVLHKDNLVEQHIQHLQVNYTYYKLFMIQEPLLVVLAMFLLCIAVIVYVRCDFSIGTHKPQKSTIVQGRQQVKQSQSVKPTPPKKIHKKA